MTSEVALRFEIEHEFGSGEPTADCRLTTCDWVPVVAWKDPL